MTTKTYVEHRITIGELCSKFGIKEENFSEVELEDEGIVIYMEAALKEK